LVDPETRNLSLEQIDLLFTGSKVAMRIDDVQPDAEMAFSRTGSVVGPNIMPSEDKTISERFDKIG